MPNSFVHFALRGSTQAELGESLGRCIAEFLTWQGRAHVILDFIETSNKSNLSVALRNQVTDLFEFAIEEGFIASARSDEKPRISRNIIDHVVRQRIETATLGTKIAAVITLHTAFEQFLWRMIRFGLVANRDQGLEWISDKKIVLRELRLQSIEQVMSESLEKWWEQQERESILSKWDRFVGLFGFPTRLDEPPWRFERKMLEEFDHVRHEAVHDQSALLAAFDLNEFAKQLNRAAWFLAFYVCQKMDLKIPENLLEEKS